MAWEAGVGHRGRVAQGVPHVLGRVRRKEAQDDGDGLGGFADGRVRRAGTGVDDLAGGVDQFHELGHDHVELVAFQQGLGLVDGAVRERAQGARPRWLSRCRARWRRPGPGARRGPGTWPSPTAKRPPSRRRPPAGTAKTMVRRTASTPNLSSCSPRSTPLPRDLLMALPPLSTWPWFSSALKGSVASSMPMSWMTLVKKRAYSRCRMACSTPPTYWPTGIQSLILAGIERALGVVRGGEAQEVPGGVHERVHGVGVALGRPATGGAVDVDPAGGGGQRRGALRGQVLAAQVVRQAHGQLVVRDGHLAAVGAVDDRDRGAPEALAGQQPVAQAEVDELLARAQLLQDLDGGRDALGLGQAVQLAGVDQGALAGGGGAGDRRGLPCRCPGRRGPAGRRPWRSRGRAGRGRGRP